MRIAQVCPYSLTVPGGVQGQVLDERGIPYLVASGLDDPNALPNAKGILGKPYQCSDVEAQLSKLFP